MTTVHLAIRLEEADDNAVWWADSSDVPGFSVAADTLAELREMSLSCLREVVSPAVRLAERLVDGPVVVVGPLRQVPDVPASP